MFWWRSSLENEKLLPVKMEKAICVRIEARSPASKVTDTTHTSAGKRHGEWEEMDDQGKASSVEGAPTPFSWSPRVVIEWLFEDEVDYSNMALIV
jgi:hypothetical protein